MIVVSDTSPITNLAAVGKLGLLRALFGSVLIPPAVFHELEGYVGLPVWVEVREVGDPWLHDSASPTCAPSVSPGKSAKPWRAGWGIEPRSPSIQQPIQVLD